MSKEVPVDAPWRAAKALECDGQTFETWIRDNSSSPRFKRIVSVATRPIFGAEPRELSLLFVLFYIAASGDEQNPGTFERNFNTRDGAQMFRFEGGSQRIATELASRLGARVLLRQPVRRIDQSAQGVTAYCDRLQVTARRAIVTAPPALAARIEYVPPVRDRARPAHAAPRARATWSRSRPSTSGRSGATRASTARPSRSTGRST